MARSTYGTYLMQGTGSGTLTYAKLIDIKTFPDLIGNPEMIDVTTLSDGQRLYIPGIKDTGGGLEFQANYTKTDYTTLEGTVGHFAIWLGHDSSKAPDGHDGKFSFDGMLSVGLSGGNVNEAVNMVITIAPTTEIEFA